MKPIRGRTSTAGNEGYGSNETDKADDGVVLAISRDRKTERVTTVTSKFKPEPFAETTTIGGLPGIVHRLAKAK